MFEMIGKYNVDFYNDPILDHNTNEEYYMLIISEFNGNKEVKRRTLYVLMANRSYSTMYNLLRKKENLEKLIDLKENQRVAVMETTIKALT